ncbi:MAG: cobalamin biosynthesis protein, partial [Clostridium sp.]
YNIPFKVYSKKELEKVEGNFTESDFVKSVTGISNVCERAAIIENKKGKLKVKKTIGNKVTLALYIEEWGGVFE